MPAAPASPSGRHGTRSAASALENPAIGAGAAQDDSPRRKVSSPRKLRSVELLISDQATPDRLLDLNL
jgi:hypothetical protein